MKKDIKKTVLDKVKDGKIAQKSKWYFLTKDYIFWLMAILSTVLGGLAFSTIIFQLSEFGELNRLRTEHLVESFFMITPFW
jgi:hypothetical protein